MQSILRRLIKLEQSQPERLPPGATIPTIEADEHGRRYIRDIPLFEFANERGIPLSYYTPKLVKSFYFTAQDRMQLYSGTAPQRDIYALVKSVRG